MIPHGPRDVESIRRGLRAGGVVWAAAALVLVTLSATQGLTWVAVRTGIALGLVFGAIVATGWVWLSVLLDVLANVPPSRRRWLTALGLTAFMTVVAPVIFVVVAGS